MSKIDPALEARLSASVTTLCYCWRLLRQDGTRICLTDHDQSITLDGDVFEPGAAIEAGTFTRTSDLRPGQAAAGGALSTVALSEQDLKDGLWEGARVDVFVVDWQAPELGCVPIWAGYMTDVTHTDQGAFEASLVSLKADLERTIGREISRHCDADLGDTRCGVSDTQDRVCDQRFETCRDIFQNTQNFRGFPHMPGPDFVIAGPGAGPHDGGKR